MCRRCSRMACARGSSSFVFFMSMLTTGLCAEQLKFWKLEDVLVDKYGIPRAQAQEIASFLLPMLKYDPAERASARDMLNHPWLVKMATKKLAE